MCLNVLMMQELNHGDGSGNIVSRNVECDECISKQCIPIKKRKLSTTTTSMKTCVPAVHGKRIQAKHSTSLKQQQKKKKVKRRSVRFTTKNDKTFSYPPVQEADRPYVWYQNYDYYQIRKEMLQSLKVFEGLFNGISGHTVNMNEHCLRGMETAVSMELYETKQRRIINTKQVVLYQQNLHKMAGISDPERIGIMAAQAAQEAQEAATATGTLDYQATLSE